MLIAQSNSNPERILEWGSELLIVLTNAKLKVWSKEVNCPIQPQLPAWLRDQPVTTRATLKDNFADHFQLLDPCFKVWELRGAGIFGICCGYNTSLLALVIKHATVGHLFPVEHGCKHCLEIPSTSSSGPRDIVVSDPKMGITWGVP